MQQCNIDFLSFFFRHSNKLNCPHSTVSSCFEFDMCTSKTIKVYYADPTMFVTVKWI